MKNVLFFVSVLLLSLNVAAQQHEIRGTVSYGEQPLEGAIVRVEGKAFGTTTGANGTYSLQLEEGSYRLVFSFGNRNTLEVDLRSDLVLNVDLNDSEEVLEEMRIVVPGIK